MTLIHAILGLLALASAPGSRVEERDIVVGQTLLIRDVKAFAIEDPQILDGRTRGRKQVLILRALRPGASRVLLHLKSAESARQMMDIQVAQRDPAAIERELSSSLRRLPEVKLRRQRTQLILEGSVQTEQELLPLREIERKHGKQVLCHVSVKPASPLVPAVVSGPPGRAMIRLDLHYVQVRRRMNRNFGVHYPATVRGSSILNAFLATGEAQAGAQAALVSDLMPNLDLNESYGYVRVLRTDTLLTEDGTRAVYRSGTELPVRLQGTLSGGSLEKIFYGSELTITPRLSAATNTVALEVNALVSSRDNAALQDGVPGRALDSINTSIHVPLGQSAMLSGLNLRSSANSRTGIPWLQHVPILGYLFGSESKDAESAAGVLYITPTLIEPGKNSLRPQIEEALKYFEEPNTLPVPVSKRATVPR